MNRPLRFGVIGLGTIGRHHTRILSELEGVDLVGGLDRVGDTTGAMGHRPVVQSLDAFLDLGVEAAIVALPPEYHADIAAALARAGVHTLVEKPLYPTAAGASAIEAAFRGRGLVAAVGHVERFNPAVQALSTALREGLPGSLHAFKTRRCGPRAPRSWDVGVVKDLAIHDVDLLAWLGGGFDRITAVTTCVLEGPSEDHVEALGRLGCGAVFTLSADWITPLRERVITVLGAHGALVADLVAQSLIFYPLAGHPQPLVQAPEVEPLRVQLEGFRDAILGHGIPDHGGQTVPMLDGVRALQVAERMLDAELPDDHIGPVRA